LHKTLLLEERIDPADSAFNNALVDYSNFAFGIIDGFIVGTTDGIGTNGRLGKCWNVICALVTRRFKRAVYSGHSGTTLV
jgi:hypothetical protein